jgi:histone acetyltransferase (RNA polymerase elongator complex component)
MQKTKHYTIPIFIPDMACIGNCIFCDQKNITSHSHPPTKEDIQETIKTHLQSIPNANAHIEVGFFGGSFTGLSITKQKEYLQEVQSYIEDRKVHSIRLSTRPDMIDDDILRFLIQYHVKTVELGAQTFDKDVLQKSGRGHSIEDTYTAAEKIKAAGIILGLQMMIGLPADTLEKALHTANTIVELGATNTRIYPLLVIKNTELEQMYKSGEYKPLSLDASVDYLSKIIPVFEKANITILRVGLHQSEGLNSGDALIAGPYHPSIKELAISKIWKEQFQPLLQSDKYSDNIIIEVHPKEINSAIGYHASNKKMLLTKYKQIKFLPNPKITHRDYHVNNS